MRYPAFRLVKKALGGHGLTKACHLATPFKKARIAVLEERLAELALRSAAANVWHALESAISRMKA